MTVLSNDAPAVLEPARPGSAGLLLGLLSAASFGLSGALARGLLEAGWSTGAAVTARVVVAALVLTGPAVVALRGRWGLLAGNAGLVSAYGVVAVAGCQYAFFNAVAHLQVGVAILIEYTAPVAVVTWLWLRYGHRPGPLTAAGGVLAAAGLLLVLDLRGAADVSVVGVCWALAAMLGAATYFVLSAQRGNGLPPLVLAAGGLVVGSLALIGAGAAGLVPMTVTSTPAVYAAASVPWWVPVAGLGTVTAALAYTSGIAAGRRLGSRLASFVALSEVVAALLWAWLLVGELPRPVQVLGGALILAGVVVVKLGERPGGAGAGASGQSAGAAACST